VCVTQSNLTEADANMLESILPNYMADFICT